MLYYVVKSESCSVSDIDKLVENELSSTRIRRIIIGIAFCVVVIICLVLLLVVSTTWYMNKRRLQKKKDDSLYAKLLDFELAQTEGHEDSKVQLATTMKINIDELTFTSKISEGAYGAVFRGVWCNQDVAIKRLKVEDEDAFVREVSVLNCLRHPNVLMLYGYSVDGKGNKYIITE